ncbi:MAG: AAA family ATPase [Clostridia bacterium]|nr:AAA family ATPase [Clostridia bacterium]MDR3645902.1 AAA family ATPase [Clostridia bacterium]
MEKLRVYIISPSKEKSEAVIKSLAPAKDIDVSGTAAPGAGALGGLSGGSPDAVIMVSDGDAQGSDAVIFETVQRLYVSMPSCPIILIDERQDIEVLQKAVKAGVRNILRWPPDQKELADNIRYLCNLEATRRSGAPQSGLQWQSQVVTVFGTKGGIGKTTVAVNLAAALSSMRKKVAILDLDLQFGDVGVFLDLEAKDTISELVTESAIDIDRISTYLMLHSSGINVLCAPKSPEYAETVGSNHVEQIISAIRHYYDYVIIDTGPVFNDPTLTALELSNNIFFILTQDVSTLRNAKISLGILDSLHHREKTGFIVNRESKGTITIPDCERVLGAPVVGRIPCDWNTAVNAINRGVPFIIDQPNSKISLAVQNLARYTCGLKK